MKEVMREVSNRDSSILERKTQKLGIQSNIIWKWRLPQFSEKSAWWVFLVRNSPTGITFLQTTHFAPFALFVSKVQVRFL